jgi:hypothetical protein
MKIPFQLTIKSRVVAYPPLFPATEEGESESDLVQTTVLDCSWAPPISAGKEGAELIAFTDFAKSNEFWVTVEALRPGTPRAETISIQKNSDGDDPPDLSVLLPTGSIGIEITDCSPIAACVAKVSAQMGGGAAIPGVSDAKTLREVKEFMSRPTSLVQPHVTDLAGEQKDLVAYLVGQIGTKDVPGNDILLLANSFMGGWPESEFATIAKRMVQPKHIQRIILVNQTRCTLI